MRSRVVGAMVAAAILIGGYAVVGGGGSSFTANLFVVASGGTGSCVYSATPQTYAYAVANQPTMICGAGSGENAIDRACRANAAGSGSGGSIIGVTGGNYGNLQVASAIDCSGGRGADVDPNCAEQQLQSPGSCPSTGTTAAWAHFQCADGSATKNVVMGSGLKSFQIIHSTSHLSFEGGCFDLGTVNVGAGGDPSFWQTAEVQFVGGSGCATNPASTDCIHTQGLECQGCKDVLFKNIDHGDFLMCINVAAPDTWRRCDTGVAFEAPLASLGSVTSGCTTLAEAEAYECGGYWTPGTDGYRLQDYIHQGSGSVYQNVREENVYEHDVAAVFSGIHVGCIQTDEGDPTLPGAQWSNLVLDHIVCERYTGAYLQLSNDGITVENSEIYCVGPQGVQYLSSQNWDECSTTQPQMGPACKASSSCVQSNIVIANNTFYGDGTMPSISIHDNTGGFGTHTNTYVVGNLFQDTGPSGCSQTGVTCDHNAYATGISTVGSNPASLGCSDPFVQSNPVVSDHSWRVSLVTDGHLTSAGRTCVGSYDASALAAPYQTTLDGDGNARVLSSQVFGAFK